MFNSVRFRVSVFIWQVLSALENSVSQYPRLEGRFAQVCCRGTCRYGQIRGCIDINARGAMNRTQ